jgi:hypothetical protein
VWLVGGARMLASLNFELKLLVDPARVLEPDGTPTHAVQTLLELDRSKRISMQFLDSTRLELSEAGWNARIRAFSDEDQLQLTYKKRYPVAKAVDVQASIRAAMEQGGHDGFESDPTIYEAQVEWGRDSKTLTLSLTTTVPQRESNPLDLPGERQSRELSARGVPLRLDQQQTSAWVRSVLLHAHVYGPVFGRRWMGELSGNKVSMEVWQIRGAPGAPDDQVVEVSLKEDDPTVAEARFSGLFDFLHAKDWLQDRAALKTNMILTRY